MNPFPQHADAEDGNDEPEIFLKFFRDKPQTLEKPKHQKNLDHHSKKRGKKEKTPSLALDNFQLKGTTVSDLVVCTRFRRERLTEFYRILILSVATVANTISRFRFTTVDDDDVVLQVDSRVFEMPMFMTGNPKKQAKLSAPIPNIFLCLADEDCPPIVRLGIHATAENVKAFEKDQSQIVLNLGVILGDPARGFFDPSLANLSEDRDSESLPQNPRCPITVKLLQEKNILFLTKSMLRQCGSVQHCIRSRLKIGDLITQDNLFAVRFLVKAYLKNEDTNEIVIAHSKPFHFVHWGDEAFCPIIQDMGNLMDLDEDAFVLPRQTTLSKVDLAMSKLLREITREDVSMVLNQSTGECSKHDGESRDDVYDEMDESDDHSRPVGAAIPQQIPHGENDQIVTPSDFLIFKDDDLMETNNFPKALQRSLDSPFNQTQAKGTNHDHQFFFAFEGESPSTLPSSLSSSAEWSA